MKDANRTILEAQKQKGRTMSFGDQTPEYPHPYSTSSQVGLHGTRHRCLRVCVTVIASLLLTGLAHAEDWAQWRGPNFNGSTSETNLPSKWSRTENVAWSADLPGASAGTPIVSANHVFVSSTDQAAQTLLAMAFDRKTGKQLWSHTIGQGISQDSRSNFASPSPAADGQIVVFFYGNGELAAFDYSGKKLWQRNIQKDYGDFCFQWTFSSSPLLFDGKLYLQVLQRDVPVHNRGITGKKNESYLLAMNPSSGKTLWRHVRPAEAVAESLEAFSTPIPYTHDGRTELLVVGGDDITGHNPDTGKELWRWGTWNPTRIGHWRLVPSPVAGDGVVLACAPKRDPIYAVQVGGSGVLGDEALAWTSEDQVELSSDVPTPAFYDGDFFVLSDVRKTLSRVEPRTGKVKWTMKTPGSAKFEASPLAADGKVYIINFIGDVVVVDANNGEIISNISMDEPADDAVRSSVIAAGGQLFIRTNRKLYCIGS